MSRHVCRERPTETVTWKGTGCELCTLDALGTQRATKLNITQVVQATADLSDVQPEKKPRELR